MRRLPIIAAAFALLAFSACAASPEQLVRAAQMDREAQLHEAAVANDPHASGWTRFWARVGAPDVPMSPECLKEGSENTPQCQREAAENLAISSNRSLAVSEGIVAGTPVR